VRAQTGTSLSVEHKAKTLFSGYLSYYFKKPKQGFGGHCKLAIFGLST
jgi:hypothetical protein